MQGIARFVSTTDAAWKLSSFSMPRFVSLMYEKRELFRMTFVPAYRNLLRNGELARRAALAAEILRACTACPHDCRVDRLNGDAGKCCSYADPVVSSYTLHFGEEPVLSGSRGAGNIFFGNCNLRCVYCQNFEISQRPARERENEVPVEKLADIMIELQSRGAHNIGLVSPTHFTPQILMAIAIAAEKGLCLPIIYNSNGYDSPATLRLFDGIIDIYLPDLKYGSNEYGNEYSKAENYFDNAKAALREMYRQTGSALHYEGDVVCRGLIIRHLVLPNDLSETEAVLTFIARELSPEVHISLMSQYFPAHKAAKHSLLSRGLRSSEYSRAILLMESLGLRNGWIQEPESEATYRPYFEESRANPFRNAGTEVD